jgi:hypothetical protein
LKARPAPWWRLALKTVRLAGGINFGHPYDYSNACPTCGCGAVPLEPLVVDLARMGKKQIDQTANDGHIIVATSLAQRIEAAGLTGIRLRRVRSRRSREADARFRWLEVTQQWPQMEPTSVVAVDDLCPRCHRTGHFDPGGGFGAWRYDQPPACASDFNQTWERLGYWRGKGWPLGQRGVGGAPGVIVSERARRLLEGCGVRVLTFVPILFESAG